MHIIKTSSSSIDENTITEVAKMMLNVETNTSQFVNGQSNPKPTPGFNTHTYPNNSNHVMSIKGTVGFIFIMPKVNEQIAQIANSLESAITAMEADKPSLLDHQTIVTSVVTNIKVKNSQRLTSATGEHLNIKRKIVYSEDQKIYCDVNSTDISEFIRTLGTPRFTWVITSIANIHDPYSNTRNRTGHRWMEWYIAKSFMSIFIDSDDCTTISNYGQVPSQQYNSYNDIDLYSYRWLRGNKHVYCSFRLLVTNHLINPTNPQPTDQLNTDPNNNIVPLLLELQNNNEFPYKKTENKLFNNDKDNIKTTNAPIFKADLKQIVHTNGEIACTTCKSSLYGDFYAVPSKEIVVKQHEDRVEIPGTYITVDDCFCALCYHKTKRTDSYILKVNSPVTDKTIKEKITDYKKQEVALAVLHNGITPHYIDNYPLDEPAYYTSKSHNQPNTTFMFISNLFHYHYSDLYKIATVNNYKVIPYAM